MRLREHPAIGEGRTDILPADPRQLSVIEHYNVRDLTTPEARAELDDLKAQVKEHGVKTPLVVRFDGEKIWIVEGHRRHLVVMELIAEHKASKGTEGRNIDFVPIKAEAPGTSDIDRDFGLETSNSGSRLKPLELANLIYRLREQRGLGWEAVAKGLGKSVMVVKNTLALRAMPEPVKAEVNNGTVSATAANRLLKNLPAGTDPEFARQLIKDAADEKERLTGKRRATPKQLARAARAPAPKEEPKDGAQAARGAKDRDAAEAQDRAIFDEQNQTTAPVHAQLQPAADRERGPSMAEVKAQIETITARPATADPEVQRVNLVNHLNGKLHAIVAKLAQIGEEACLPERADGEKIEVPVELIRDADRVYRQSIGEIPA